ncbi:hypothetical protein EDD18DRAFT_1427989 [Armillaria luteobubalina]|uniref:Transmembrane protein n=1 Tax=Armillaria luteobubalina TaxID=153913 RepID=A0AA39PJP1_9AGAR|nr:hypothetical protein EDD18DRAFT_1427989 [Armillaria luteobubalina]
MVILLSSKADRTNALPDSHVIEQESTAQRGLRYYIRLYVSIESENNMLPSHLRPLQVAPLPSAKSAGVSLLDDYGGSKPQIRVSYGGRRRLPIAVIIPGILIFIASAGLASSLLIWLQSRRVESHIQREDPYFLNGIVAIEGKRALHKLNDGSFETDTTMYGLALSAVSAQLVSLTVPFLLGLLGYRLASMWILAQEKEHTGSMPTAAQYGLLVKLCGSANIFSAYETVQYLKRGRERRSQAPSSMTFAFVVLVLAILLNHLLSYVYPYLWLHTTVSTFIHTSMTPIGLGSLPDTGTKINLTMCPGPMVVHDKGDTFMNGTSLNGTDYCTNCDGNYKEMVAEGLAVIGNSSSMSRSVIVNDMAVLVPSTMPENVDGLTFSSFGLVAHCQPVVDCLVESDASGMDTASGLYCPSFIPPYNINTTVTGRSSGSTIDMFNLTNNALSKLPGYYPVQSFLNPYGARLAAYWSTGEAIFPADSSPGWYHLYYRSCYGSLDGNNMYVFVSSPVLSDFNTASVLFSAFNPTYQINIVDYLKSTLRTSFTLSTETFNKVLSRNMAFAAMSLALPLFKRNVSTGGNYIVQRSASRYPLAPLTAVLAILYTYAILALAIILSSVMLSSREVIATKDGGSEHKITAIELVQL